MADAPDAERLLPWTVRAFGVLARRLEGWGSPEWRWSGYGPAPRRPVGRRRERR